MKKGGRAARLKLFEKLATDLGNNLIGKKDVVLCPLCLKECPRAAAEHAPEVAFEDRLTEEHVIPASAGHREVTLTCKHCNDTLGATLDAHLARKIRLDRAVNSGVSVRAKLQWDGGGAPTDFRIDEDARFHLRVKPTTGKMEHLLFERMNEYATGQRELRLTLRSNVDRMSLAASLVKAAYLGLFVDRGYRYILMPALELIRDAIRADSVGREQLHGIVIRAGIGDVGELPVVPDRITFETASLGGVPVCVSMINLKNASGSAFVVLPPETSFTGSWDGLARAAEAFKTQHRFEIQMSGGGTLTLNFGHVKGDPHAFR